MAAIKETAGCLGAAQREFMQEDPQYVLVGMALSRDANAPHLTVQQAKQHMRSRGIEVRL